MNQKNLVFFTSFLGFGRVSLASGGLVISTPAAATRCGGGGSEVVLLGSIRFKLLLIFFSVSWKVLTFFFGLSKDFEKRSLPHPLIQAHWQARCAEAELPRHGFFGGHEAGAQTSWCLFLVLSSSSCLYKCVCPLISLCSPWHCYCVRFRGHSLLFKKDWWKIDRLISKGRFRGILSPKDFLKVKKSKHTKTIKKNKTTNQKNAKKTRRWVKRSSSPGSSVFLVLRAQGFNELRRLGETGRWPNGF